jgi:chromosome segregation ATPase
MDTGMLSLVKNYGDVAIGLILLIAGVWVLPGRIKWYVLTAGLAVIGYEAYLRMSNRKLMAEADREREKLRARVAVLDKRGAELESTVAQLNEQLAENKAKQAALDQRAADLAKRGEDISAQKAQLDEESQRRSRENEALLQTVVSHEDLLAALQDARHALDQMDEAKP